MVLLWFLNQNYGNDIVLLVTIGRIAKRNDGGVRSSVESKGVEGLRMGSTVTLEFGEEDWEDVISVSLSSAFYLSQATARNFLEPGHGGKIISMASVLSFQGGILMPSYTAAMAGLANLTRALSDAADYVHGAILPVNGGWLGR
jgi:NAD(P)-dependent dehydrogenase (short-subunit alcohol dehydrogenase family)